MIGILAILFIRWTVGAMLLVLSWMHVHWSAALVLTLLAVRCELEDTWNTLERAMDRDLDDLLRRNAR